MKQLLCLIAVFSFSLLNAIDSSVPLLHLSDYKNKSKKEAFLQALEHAVEEVGYFAITDVGIEQKSLENAYEQAKVFFALKKDLKMGYLSPNGHRGYTPGESAKDETRIDYKEFYHIGRELSQTDLDRLHYEDNIWPSKPTNFRSVMKPLFQELDKCKDILGEAFSEILDQKKRFIREMIHEGDCLMRVIHYPNSPPKDAFWAGAHTDVNLFTLYPPATSSGLQVKNNHGQWIDIDIPEGMFFVHCGDMLENLSNGLCKSITHRVADPGLDQDRYALVFFVHPRSDDRLDPLPNCIEKTGGVRRYANVSRVELLAERLIDLGLASDHLMGIFVQSGAIEKLKEVHRFSSKAETVLIKKGFIPQPESPDHPHL